MQHLEKRERDVKKENGFCAPIQNSFSIGEKRGQLNHYTRTCLHSKFIPEI